MWTLWVSAGGRAVGDVGRGQGWRGGWAWHTRGAPQSALILGDTVGPGQAGAVITASLAAVGRGGRGTRVASSADLAAVLASPGPVPASGFASALSGLRSRQRTRRYSIGLVFRVVLGLQKTEQVARRVLSSPPERLRLLLCTSRNRHTVANRFPRLPPRGPEQRCPDTCLSWWHHTERVHRLEVPVPRPSLPPPSPLTATAL